MPCLLTYNVKDILRDDVLTDLETEIDDIKKEIVNLTIAGLQHKAEEKRRTLRWLWEFWSELDGKIRNLEEEAKR